ncbi:MULTISPECIES: DUF1496 domain-containing protein [Tenebrionibacter/Tenebrionicola group]|jgi:hypothetical protein|uniref:YnjH family protein n=2 Tax=Tenebrionibacter/Tenebrionicola group TaxID=2969848 RepID=A0A8K0V0F7_9ENTR|nr:MULTISPECIES: DUF1496 domain-containing protein [Tenebrionibacter/Tenebrionicola group]MBK4714221.1 YnjH family protein [Tenebrionibacter intestinalis]MBV4413374.1 YnjH family protein [Tenebrionicola larvae]MBV5094258.1 YnjH family protein [Tenebrionicola larvae]
MSRFVIAGLLALWSAGVQADRQPRPGIELNVAPELFNHRGQRAQPCNRCCVYQDQNYSQGAVIRVGSVLLQCQRDEKTVGTNPLLWRRIRE